MLIFNQLSTVYKLHINWIKTILLFLRNTDKSNENSLAYLVVSLNHENSRVREKEGASEAIRGHSDVILKPQICTISGRPDIKVRFAAT